MIDQVVACFPSDCTRPTRIQDRLCGNHIARMAGGVINNSLQIDACEVVEVEVCVLPFLDRRPGVGRPSARVARLAWLELPPHPVATQKPTFRVAVGLLFRRMIGGFMGSCPHHATFYPTFCM